MLRVTPLSCLYTKYVDADTLSLTLNKRETASSLFPNENVLHRTPSLTNNYLFRPQIHESFDHGAFVSYLKAKFS